MPIVPYDMQSLRDCISTHNRPEGASLVDFVNDFPSLLGSSPYVGDHTIIVVIELALFKTSFEKTGLEPPTL